MGGDSPSPPPAKDPGQVATTQQGYNVGAGTTSQAGSMVDQSNPWMSLDYQQTGVGPNGVPIYSASTTFAPEVQSMYDRLRSDASGQLNMANYGGASAASTIGGMTSGMTQDMLAKEVSYLDPFFTQQTSQLDTQLRNQGIGPESPAYKTAMNNLGQTQNQSVTGFLAQAFPTAYGLSKDTYMTPLNIAQTELGMVDPSKLMPGFLNTPQLNVQPANYQGAVQNYQDYNMAKYQEDQKNNQAMMSGLFGIPTALLGGVGKGAGAAIGAAMV